MATTMMTKMKATAIFCAGFVRLLLSTMLTMVMMVWWWLTASGHHSLRQSMTRVLADTALRDHDCSDSVFSLAHIQNVFHAGYVGLCQQARMHAPAPDPMVWTLNAQSVSLLASSKQGRPLLEGWRVVVEEFGHVADFLLVYIQEAHPADGWAFPNNPFSIRDHRTLEDRLSAARQLVSTCHPGCDVMVDNMADEANYKYGALYERLYIVLNHHVVFVGQPGPQGFSVHPVSCWLTEFTHS